VLSGGPGPELRPKDSGMELHAGQCELHSGDPWDGSRHTIHELILLVVEARHWTTLYGMRAPETLPDSRAVHGLVRSEFQLLHGQVEADSYWCLCKLLDGIQDHYTYAQPGIQRTVFHLKELVRCSLLISQLKQFCTALLAER
jgi:Rab-GTPase-TBC domain